MNKKLWKLNGARGYLVGVLKHVTNSPHLPRNNIVVLSSEVKRAIAAIDKLITEEKANAKS